MSHDNDSYRVEITDKLTAYNKRYGANQERLNLLIEDLCEIRPTHSDIDQFLSHWKQYHAFMPKLSDYNKWSKENTAEKPSDQKEGLCRYKICDASGVILTQGRHNQKLYYVICLCQQNRRDGQTSPLDENVRSLVDVQTWLNSTNRQLDVLNYDYSMVVKRESLSDNSYKKDIEMFYDDIMALYENDKFEPKPSVLELRNYINLNTKYCKQYADEKRNGRGEKFLERFKKEIESIINKKGVKV